MVVNNTVKYKGCAGDRIMVCSVQSFVRDKRGELSSAKYIAHHYGSYLSCILSGINSNSSICKELCT